MKKLIILFLLITFNFGFAQVYPYFSFKKTSGGLMIGVETLNQKTNDSLKISGYHYEWTFPEISLEPRKTTFNTIFLSWDQILDFLTVNLKISRPLSKETYNLKTTFQPPKPQVKIVKISDGLLMPLSFKVNKEEFLTVLLKNFSSKNYQYLWELNGAFLSKEKEIPATFLKENGLLRVKVFGSSPQETAVDEQIINIE